MPELAATPWAAERGAFVEVAAGPEGVPMTVPQSSWRFADAEAGAPEGAVVGERGQHNREVLAELAGLDSDTLDTLEAQGVISSGEPIRRPNTPAR